MNIFFLDCNPRLCAQYHCDRHVVKMILETVQILCTVHYILGSRTEGYDIPYKKTHTNHPCCIWARESLINYRWLCLLGKELCKEYTHRYGKTHASEKYVYELSKQLPLLDGKHATVPVLAMPDEYKTEDDPVKSYRDYYRKGKEHVHLFTKWKKREIPYWLYHVAKSSDSKATVTERLDS